MVDVKVEIQEALESIGLDPYIAYPQKWTTLPVVSFYEIAAAQAVLADNIEIAQSSTIVVDVWAKKPKQTFDVGERINAKLQAEGWKRGNAMDLFELETNLHHRNLRFSKTIYF